MDKASDFFRPVEVTLREDLTKYHALLKPGVLGMTVAPVGVEATASERFCRVRFHLTAGDRFSELEVDVLWSGLEVTDEGWKAEVRRLEEARVDAIAATSREAVRYVGQRGGFRKLVVPYAMNGQPQTWIVKGRAERKKCEAILARLNVPIREVIER